MREREREREREETGKSVRTSFPQNTENSTHLHTHKQPMLEDRGKGGGAAAAFWVSRAGSSRRLTALDMMRPQRVFLSQPQKENGNIACSIDRNGYGLHCCGPILVDVLGRL